MNKIAVPSPEKEPQVKKLPEVSPKKKISNRPLLPMNQLEVSYNKSNTSV